MFSSISKAWNEVSEESDNGVKFSKSVRDSPNKKSAHYIRYDKPKNPLDRKRKSDHVGAAKKGSPRILKPANESKQNSVWGSALKNLSKVFKKDDCELGSMKEYMNGMINVPKERQGLNRSNRSNTLNIEDIDNDSKERTSRRRKRSDTISSRLESIGNSLSADRYKRRRQESNDTSKFGSRFDYSKYEINVPKYESPAEPRFESKREPNYSTSSKKDTSFYEFGSWKSKKETPKPFSTSKGIQFKKLTALDLPSSPIFSSNPQPLASRQEDTKSNVTVESHLEKSNMDSSRIETLCKKVEQLENTVESLRDELRQANEKSLQMEKSIQSNDHSILKHLHDDSDDLDHFKFDTDKDISRPLSPVKIDLDRFKFIR